MRIRHKLLLGFGAVALLLSVVVYTSTRSSREELEDAIGRRSAAFAAMMLDRIDRAIYSRIESVDEYCRGPLVQRFIAASHEKFERSGDVRADIQAKDEAWRSVPQDEITPFMRGIIDNELSEALRRTARFYEEKYGYRMFAEVFVTNKYGVNIAQTAKTSDYYQADEPWWQNARRDRVYVGDVDYDRSAGIRSTDLCIRIDDEEGNFAGVVKVVLNIAEVIELMKAEEMEERHFVLSTGDRRVIYVTKGHETATGLGPNLDRNDTRQTQGRAYCVGPGDVSGEGDQLFAWARSRGYAEFPGLGWVLVVERATDEVFAPIARLERRVAGALAAAVALIVGLALLISNSVSRPVARLCAAATDIGRGRLSTRVDVRAGGELAVLGYAFNKMAEDLATTTTSVQTLNDEVVVRRQAEEERALAAQQWQQTFDAISDPVMLVDTHHRIVMANRALRDAFPVGELVGSNCFCLVHATGEPPDACPVTETLRTGEPAQVEIQEPHLDNHWFDASTYPVKNEGGETVQVVHIIRDITDRKLAEAELVKARETAEAANEAKSAFLANMSHEIRTPLTAILGYTDLMADPGQSGEEKTECLATVRRNGEHLLCLINDILDLSKIEAGKLELHPDPCSIPAVVAEVISLMRVRAKQGGISLAAEYAGEIPETVFTDEARARQVLLNLVGNAVKFTKEGGVRIVTTLVPQWRGDEAALKIDVIDTGVGIAPEDVERLCRPFTQVDDSMSRRHSGTGLGLAISRRLAEMMGGSLTIRSRPGTGSTFTLTIPAGPLEGVAMLADPGEAVLSAPRVVDELGQAPLSLAGVHVLLAEDGPDNQRLISTVLRKAGAVVKVVENGRLAVDAALSEPFDVILMDMQMPEMDGYDAATLLREKGYDDPIVALTAHALTEDRQRCLDAGCSDYLMKPIDRAKLIATVADHSGVKTHAGASDAPGEQRPDQEEADAILSRFADDADLAGILDDVVGGLGQHLASMRRALSARQFDELQREAHQLKGAGGSYGYPDLTDAARVLEMTANNHDTVSGAVALERLATLSRAIIRGWGTCASSKETEQ